MPLESGSRLGPYEIGISIGKGGMGEVYKARDSRVGRDVAIKISSEQFSERFEREARAIAALNHPNICTLYDVGPSYLVMEYIDGESPQRDPKTLLDVWLLPLSEPNAKESVRTPKLFLATPFNEDQAHISPDGRLIAYRSNESGRNEVYVRSFPDGDGRWQISKDGGANPRWRADGKELFFTGPNLSVMAVDLSLGPNTASVPKFLFSGRQTTLMDIASDGQRFLWADTLDEQVVSPILVVVGALKK